VILGVETKTIWGTDTITDILLGKKFVISPNSFYQVNHSQCEKLYSKAMEYASLTGNETVVDLYCGAGTIGLTMADKAKQIFGIEIVPQAIDNAKINAKLNEITNAEFFCGDAYEGAKALEKRGVNADVVILDPPRKGCQKELFDIVQMMNPKKIVYVSCDSATLARDLEILNQKGYIAEEITPVDMFPRTPHIECVAKIVKID
jgi:23S rRNA (uracil1939-C5)-methyltransferase